MKKCFKVFLAVIMTATFVGCGNRDYDGGFYGNADMGDLADTEYYAPAEYATDYESDSALAYTADSSYDMKAAGYSGRTEATPEETPEPSPENDSAKVEQKLVYRGSMNLETLTYPETVKETRAHIAKYNGIIENEYERDNDSSWYYTDGRGRTVNRVLNMTVRIPTKDFENFLTDMEGTAKVTSRNQSVENISRRYNDNSIEIEALEKQQERLLEMMDKAETIEEMIMVEERLSYVQSQLNQKKSYRSTMDTDVNYSTIDLSISEVQKYTPQQESGINIDGFGEKFVETFKYSWKFFTYVIQNLILFLIQILPFILLGAVIILLIKAYRKSKGLDTRLFRRKKKEEKDWKAYTESKKAEMAKRIEAKNKKTEVKEEKPKTEPETKEVTVETKEPEVKEESQ